MGTYTSTTLIRGVTQFTDSGSTTPTTTQIEQWITEIEADADARALGSYTLTDQLIDVLPGIMYPAKDTIAWLEALAGQRFDEIRNLVVIPPFIPIVSISSLSRRTSTLGSTDTWEALNEGTSSDDHYIQYKKKTKTNKYLGFALYFYSNNPTPGYQRIKMTYNHGWNLSTDIIGEWCTLKVALKVFTALLEANTPVGAGDYAIGDTSIGVDLERRVVITKERLKELEDRYFPKEELGIVLF